MANKRNVYGEVKNKSDMRKVFSEIRKDVDNARSRPALTELYKRAGYLVTLTHAPSWKEKFGKEARELRQVGEKQFSTTAKKINSRARKIGAEADYDETWGK